MSFTKKDVQALQRENASLRAEIETLKARKPVVTEKVVENVIRVTEPAKAPKVVTRTMLERHPEDRAKIAELEALISVLRRELLAK